MIKKYVAYLRDNPEKLWFKRKLYGWGWVPVSWQGYGVTALFLWFVFWNALSLESDREPIDFNFHWYFGKLTLAVIVLLIICYKTGEKPRWRWGITKDK
ncbi:MAG: hypothetical protein WCV80_01495 [Candidatus Paceibacterota bacterium]|jgi:hypothetical protein